MIWCSRGKKFKKATARNEEYPVRKIPFTEGWHRVVTHHFRIGWVAKGRKYTSSKAKDLCRFPHWRIKTVSEMEKGKVA